MGNLSRISTPLTPGYVVHNLFNKKNKQKKNLKLFLEQLHHCPSDVWMKLQASLWFHQTPKYVLNHISIIQLNVRDDKNKRNLFGILT